jgi:peptide/nickel transport system substrate-binding protein
LNTSVREFADIRVREAVDFGIDRRRLVATVFPEGAARPAFSMVPPEVFGYSPDHRQSEFDEDRARRLLAEHGGRAKEPLRLAYAERNQLVAEHLVSVLVEIGLDVEGELLPYEVFYRCLQEESSDLFVFTWTYRVPDASQFLDTFVRTRDPERGVGTFNGVALADPEIDALIDNAVVEPNSVLRLEKLQQAVADVVGEYVYLPLYKPSRLALVRDEIGTAAQGHPMLRPQDFWPDE